MKIALFLKSIIAYAFRKPADNDAEVRLKETESLSSTADEDVNSDVDSKLLAVRQNTINDLKIWYYKLVIYIILLSLFAAIIVTVTLVLNEDDDDRILVKLGFIAYEPIVSVIFLIALKSHSSLSYGKTEHEIRLFNCCGDQVILCLMAVDLFWIIAGLTGFMANPSDWISLVFLGTSIIREVLYGLTSITSDRLVIFCVTRIAPKPQYRVSAFDRI